jgi:hypothetical protein
MSFSRFASSRARARWLSFASLLCACLAGVLSTAAPTSTAPQVCSVPGENAEDRDMDLYVVGLNHHAEPGGPSNASGTREIDLDNLADLIVQLSPDPRRVVVAATGSNPIVGGLKVYVDLNHCPANRLQHLLEEKYHTSFGAIGSPQPGIESGCHPQSEYRIIAGQGWSVSPGALVHFNVAGGEGPDHYLQGWLQHDGITVTFFLVRFATGGTDQIPQIAQWRQSQVRKIVAAAAQVTGSSVPLILGDFNFQHDADDGGDLMAFEAEPFREAGAQWITSNLKCGASVHFSPGTYTNVVSLHTQLAEALNVVGGAFTRQEGIHVIDITHELVALRLKIKSCPGGAFCSGVCTPFGTNSNCGFCGNSCGNGRCENGHCIRPHQPKSCCGPGTLSCGACDPNDHCNGCTCVPRNKPGAHCPGE